jgi:signal transduction histidine kinase
MDAELGPDDIVALNRLTTLAKVLAGTAHDVNNALQIIGGSAELLEGHADLPDAARRALRRIQGQSARAASAVADVMRFSRDRGEVTAAVSVKDVIIRAIAMRLFLVRRAGIVLDFDAAQSPAPEVRGRAAQLQQAVLNLIMNGEQALTGQLGGTIAITISEEAGDAVVRIIDNGPGPDAALGERAFDAFVTTRSRTESPGLGLAAARIIARGHGGDVTLEDRKPGCCATLRLPLATPPAT